jgi:hypothetical protein
MGARFTVTPVPECVARAGVEALARVTGVLVRAGLRFALGLETGFRAVERALPLPLRCDAFAFNCFPLFGLPPNISGDPAAPALPSTIVAGRPTRQSFFAGISGLDPGRLDLNSFL